MSGLLIDRILAWLSRRAPASQDFEIKNTCTHAAFLTENSMGLDATAALGGLFSARNCIQESKIIQPCPPPHGCHSTCSAPVSRNLCFPKPHSLRGSEICASLTSRALICRENLISGFFTSQSAKVRWEDEHVAGILSCHAAAVCVRSATC